MKCFACFLLAGVLAAQTPTPPSNSFPQSELPKEGGIATGYRTPRIAPARLEDGPRLQSLLRDGKLHLSLQDAIALALENNLDLELDRYSLRLADSDVLRSQSGALPRGIPLSVRDTPVGLGAPEVSPNGTLGGGDTPTLNSLIGPGVQIDLSQLGSLPLPTGPAIPNLDGQILGNVSWNHISDPQNNTFLPGVRSLNSDTTVANAAFQQGFTTGGTMEVFFNNSRQNLNSPLFLYNPGVLSSVGVSITQPLLRGFGWGVNRRYIRIAKNNRQVSDLVFAQQAIVTVSGVVRLYWDLVSLDEDVRVREQAVASAEQFLRDTRNQRQTGTAAEIDVTRGQSELSRRQRDLAVAHTLVRQQEAVLKDYLMRSRLDGPIANAAIVTTDKLPSPANESIPPVEELLTQALHARPDTAQVRLQLENAQFSLEGSRNALRPELDLVASAQNNGFAGAVNRQSLGATADPFLTGGYGDALTQIVHNNFPSYGAGVQLTLPLRNRAARSDVLRDELTVRQQQIRIRQLEKQIRLEVTNASLGLEQARDTYEATRNERIFQEQNVSAEQQKLDVGASTGFFVIQYQRDLAAAQSAEISALASYQKAKAALQRATGTILADYNIVMSEALAGTIRHSSAPALPPAAK